MGFKLKSALCGVGLFCALLPSVWAKDHVIILAGQSNMMGRGKTIGLPPGYRNTPGNVHFFYQGREHRLAEFGFFGPEVSFAHTLARAYPRDRIFLIKHAASGSYLKQWQPGQGLYNTLMRQISFVAQAYPIQQIDAIMWMQGESEAQSSATVATQYSDQLQNFVTHLRRDLQSPNSLFVLGRISFQHPLLMNSINIVRSQQQQAPQQIKNSLVVSTDGLTTMSDKLHYDSAGQVELGKRFATAYIRRNSQLARR